MTLAEKICTCRRKQGMSQEALAAQLNVSRQAVSKWETGDAEPESGKLIALARTFGVTVDWLLTGGGDLDEDVQKDENAGKIQELSAFPVSAPKKFCQTFRNLRPGYFLYLGCFLLLLFLSLTVTHALLPLPDFSFDLYRLRYFF